MFASTLARSRTKRAAAPIGRPAPPRSMGRTPLLQRTIGNQAMLRSLAQRAMGPFATGPEGSPGQDVAAGAIQAKLAIGEADHPLEHEADRIADQVMRMPDPSPTITPSPPWISRKCDACAQDGELQAESAGSPGPDAVEAPDIVQEELRAPGVPIDTSARAFFEPRFGRDLGHVRVHTGARAGASARSVMALAYTSGSDIVFGDGQYAPATPAGRRLLAHELTHTVQQTSGSPTSKAAATAPPAISPPLSPSGAVPHALARQAAADAGADPGIHDAGQPGGVGPPAAARPQTGEPQTGDPKGPSEPDCTTVMGGRGIEFGPMNVAGLFFNHTYVNFKENATNYWLIEGGPLPTDPKKSGAWATAGKWETRGNRKTTTWGPEDCPRVKKLLFDTTSLYHGAGLAYDPWNGPNSNSFAEHLCFKGGVPSDFHMADKAYAYWRSRPRPS